MALLFQALIDADAEAADIDRDDAVMPVSDSEKGVDSFNALAGTGLATRHRTHQRPRLSHAELL
jgi:hypothetical protein